MIIFKFNNLFIIQRNIQTHINNTKLVYRLIYNLMLIFDVNYKRKNFNNV